MATASKTDFEANAGRLIDEIRNKEKCSLVHMMQTRLLDPDPDRLSLTFAFPGQDWERNPTGAIHGGMVSAMFDTAMGITTYALNGTLTPTVSLSISYLRPAPGDGVLCVRAWVTKSGHSVMYASAEMWEEHSPELIVATAQGVFHVPQTGADREKKG